MFRMIKISALSLAALATLNAGQIQIGSNTNGADGLTLAYGSTAVAAGSSNTACRGASLGQAGFSGCAQESANMSTNALEQAYTSQLFQGATVAAPPTGTTFSNSEVTFARIADAGKQGAWQVSSTLPSTLIIPVGISGVTNVYTMLQEFWGGDGKVNTTVTFTFNGTDSSGATGTNYNVSVDLTNGSAIRAALNSTGGSGNPAKTSGGLLTIATTLTNAVTPSVTGLPGGASVSMTANNIWNSTYTKGSGTQFANTTGNVNLDYQKFSFTGILTTDWLVSISIKDQIYAGQGYSSTTAGGNNSRTALSAITVNVADAAVPEPSSIFLAFAGLGALGYWRRRKA